MRKLFSLFVAILATISLWAVDFYSGDLGYTITSSSEPYTIELSYVSISATSISIPGAVTYKGITYYVTSIGNEALSNKIYLTSVDISFGITSIGDKAFNNCSKLTSITIPNSVTSIGDMAFNKCSALTSITLPNNVTSIGNSVFASCSALTSITIPNSVTSIGDKAFSSCSKLTSITIPNSVTSIGNSAFASCSALTSITIPNSVTSIGEWAFNKCSKLTSITIPNSVTSIGDDAFFYCSKLTKTNYTGNVASWCNIKFGNSSANPMSNSHNFYINDQEIKNLVIPNTVDTIHDYAFYGCSSLVSVTTEAITPPILGNNALPSGLTVIYIPDNTLSAYQQAWGNKYTYINNETTLTLHVEIPGTLSDLIFDAGTRPINIVQLTLTGTLNDDDFTCMRETMTSLADVDLSGITNTTGVNFKNKSGLKRIILPDYLTSIEKYAFYYCSSLTSITIPNSVTSIGDNAFYSCSKLTSITIPNSVTSIGEWAFGSCYDLTSITIPSSVTSIGERAFSYSSLTSITCLGATPPAASNLGADATKCTLIVPNSAYNAYLRHAYWGQFLNIIPAYQVTLQANNAQWGEVVGDGLYTQEATISATPYEGYIFKKWSDGNTENHRTIQVISDTTLIAEFDVDRRVLVTFIDWDGTVLSSIKVTPGEAATAPADPTREGYTFIGWDKDFSAVTDNLTVTAQYQINRYCVRFLDHDNTLLKTDSVEYKSTAVAPEDPYREGYTFIGWDKDFSSITDHMTITAQYQINRYCVRFLDHDNTLLKTDSVEYLSAAMAPEDPYREGYTFIGWDKDFSAITDNLTVTAQYQINRYRVRFFNYDDTLLKTDSVEYQSAATAPAAPYRKGYTFIGWDKAFDSITSDLDIYAQYEMGEDRNMTIVFTNTEEYNNEIYSQSIIIKMPPVPEIEGFTFLYWQPVAEPINNVITIQAIYEADIPTFAPEVYINPANPAQKLLRDGQVYILKDGKTYSIMGQEM